MAERKDTKERPRGVIVHVLADEAYDVETTDRGMYAVGVNETTGETWIIHSQGVGYQVGHNKPWRFNDYSLAAKWHSLLDVRRMPTKRDVDLADWVGVFGARLESNFWGMYYALTNTSPSTKDYNPQVYEVLAKLMNSEL